MQIIADESHQKDYVWEWENGGYNSCRANSLEEAWEKARACAGNTVLVPVNVRLDPGRRIRAQYDWSYAGMFD